jgi:HAD superfamily hydrolase (TIGR01509 family)
MFKKYFNHKEVVLFDLDGTLVYSHPLWEQACSDVFENLGFTWRGSNYMKHSTLEDIWYEYLKVENFSVGVPVPTLVEQTKNKFLKLFLSTDPEELLREGFLVFADELINDRNFKLGLVTNTDRSVAEKMLSHLQIDHVFEVKIYGDTVQKKKPDPALYEAALASFDVKPRKCLAIEDSPDGVEAAVSARIDVIAARNTLYSETDFASYKLTFIPDFTVFSGNLDKTEREVYKEMRDSLDFEDSE